MQVIILQALVIHLLYPIFGVIVGTNLGGHFKSKKDREPDIFLALDNIPPLFIIYRYLYLEIDP